MAWTTMRTGRLCVLATLAAPGLGAMPASAQITAQEFLSGPGVSIHVPAGTVQVAAGAGDGVGVEVRLLGPDAGLLQLERTRVDGGEALIIRYPEGEDIVYPGVRGRTDLRIRSDGTFSGGGTRGDRIRVGSGLRGIEAWAEVTVRVPAGGDAAVHVGAGTLASDGVEGVLSLETRSGSVEARRHRGDLTVAVGSGRLDGADIEGERLSLTTGSGSIDVRGATGSEVRVRTGSGSIDLSDIQSDDLEVGTGSGGIDLTRVSSPDIRIETGSGSVEGTLLARPTNLEVGTGSGGVRLQVPDGSGAQVDVRTGSGGIDVDFPVQIETSRRGRFQGSIGDGSGRIRIVTGSGSVRLGSG